MEKLALIINVLLENHKVFIHGKALRHLFELCFKVFLKRTTKNSDSTEDFDMIFEPVQNFLRQVISHVERTSGPLMNAVFKKKETEYLKEVNVQIERSQNSMGSSGDGSLQNNNMNRMIEQSVIENESSILNESSFSGIAERMMTYLVDQTSIYIERVESLKKGYKKELDSAELDKLVSKCIPINLVPPEGCSDSKMYSKSVKVNLENELGKKSGVFGWCFVCRNTADYYCKDRRLPVCGKSCKDKLGQSFCNSLSVPFTPFESLLGDSGKKQSSEYKIDEATLYKQDIINILQYLFTLIEKELQNPQEKDLVMLKLVDSLSIILEKIGASVQVSEDLKVRLRSKLLPLSGALLFKSSIKVTQKTCNLIIIMFKRFRQILKTELYILLDNIIICGLQRELVSHELKFIFINTLTSLLSDIDLLTNIYCNYDCCLGFNNTLNRCFEILSRLLIIQLRLPQIRMGQ